MGGDNIVFLRKTKRKEEGEGEERRERWTEGRRKEGRKEKSGYLLHKVLHKTFGLSLGSCSSARLLEPHPFHQRFKQNQSSSGRGKRT